MRKVFTLSLVTLAISGCANQQPHTPQVRDLSEAKRAVESSAQYTVKPGDTLYGIAWQHDLDYRELAAFNNIGVPYQIHPGQTIALRQGAGGAPAGGAGQNAQNPPSQRPSGAVATGLNPQAVAVASSQGTQASQQGDQQMDWLLPDESAIERNQRITTERAQSDGAPSAEREAPVEREPRQVDATPAASVVDASEPEAPREPEPEPTPAAEPEPEPRPQTAPAQASTPDRSSRTFTPVDNVQWQWPTDGQVSGAFGEGGTITAGIDITGQKGQPVKAAGPGIVVYAGSGVRGYGNLILLKHNDQYLSAYAHNDSLRVSENDVVEAGEVIATMGDSDTDSVKLHFEVRRDGQPQDPLEFLPSR